MAEATKVLTELLARAFHGHAATILGAADPRIAVPIVDRRRFAGDIAIATRLDRTRVAAVLDLLILDLERCKDPCLTPLIPLASGDELVPMSSLIAPGSPVRNFTALLQLDDRRFGEAGRRLGLLGSNTVASTLRSRLDGARVAARVGVRYSDGSSAGDLDVVAYDPHARLMVVFEVLWHIGPDGSVEVARSEERAHGKREQVARLRSDVKSGRALPRWPSGWDAATAADVRWFILTPNVLPIMTVAEDGITVRSHQMVERMLRAGSSVADLVRLLDDPPIPPVPLTRTGWSQIRYGPYRIDAEYVGL
jgi:hypothetical protein